LSMLFQKRSATVKSLEGWRIMNDARRDRLAVLEQLLGYSFKDKGLLDHALIHRSYINENPSDAIGDNERLEFLGDAVLELCVSDFLMKTFTEHKEGQLSRMRASIVNEQSIAQLARRFRVGEFLRLGKGEESSGGRTKTSLLSNTFEAVIAAIYLDGGFAQAYAFLEKLFMPLLERCDHHTPFRDYKTSLQEICQNRFKAAPTYVLIREYGPDHDKVFKVRLSLPDILTTMGLGKNKKEAEQQAARKALEAIERSDVIHGEKPDPQ
jgi:ribonuclease III